LNKFQEANIFSRKLSQLYGVAHHVVVDVSIFLGDRNAPVPSQAGQHTHAYAVGGQVGDEAAAHGVTGCVCYASPFEQVMKVLGHHVGSERKTRSNSGGGVFS
jgi:hypothetical protein